MADASAHEAGLLRYLDVLAGLAKTEQDPGRLTDLLDRMERTVCQLELNRVLDRIELSLGIPAPTLAVEAGASDG